MTARARLVAAAATAVVSCATVLPALAQPTPPPAPGAAAATPPQAVATAITARPADVASADAIVAALYDVISGPAGKKRDWDRFRSLFVPGARLIPIARREGAPAQARMLTPDDYIARSASRLEQDGFSEREIARTVESYGGMTHVFSTYEARRDRDGDTPFVRGINSIQLLNDGARWWIVTVYWQSEAPDIPLPEKYLPRK